jgi:hypothetical protein
MKIHKIRFTIRGLLVAIVMIALGLGFVVQTVRLKQTEAQLRVVRVSLDKTRSVAEHNRQMARTAVDHLIVQLAAAQHENANTVNVREVLRKAVENQR